MNCKLTDKDGRTYEGCQWGENITNRAKGKGKALCSSGVIHYYEDPLLAVFANPIHGRFDLKTALLWEFKPKREINKDNLKCACKEGTTIKLIPIPEMTIEQRVEIAIRCSLEIKQKPKYVEWAKRWLDRTDRRRAAADAARAAAAAAARAAAWAAEREWQKQRFLVFLNSTPI